MKKQKHLLRLLDKSNPSIRRSILKSADEGLVKAICECTDNILKGNVHLTSTQKKGLARHRKVLRRIVRKGDGWKVKRKYIAQKGGSFLSILLPMVSNILSNLF
jgi:hypothetical protein